MEAPYKIGQAYFIRTVTHYYTGKLVHAGAHELVLDQVAWIADTGRFATALETGEFSEIEPMLGLVIIGRGAIVDASEWQHKLPDTQK